MAERKQFTVFTGGMTLREYLETAEREPEDDVPGFISRGYLMSLERRGLLTRLPSQPTEDEAR